MKPYSRVLFFILGILLLGSLSVPRVFARTDAKTVEFLKKVNLYYYCLGREGLKGFTCEVVVKVSKTYKDSLMELGLDKTLADALDGQRYNLQVSEDKKPTITWIAPPATSDGTFDSNLKEQAGRLQENFEDTINNWVEAVFKPGFDEESFQGNSIVTQTKDGFVVEEKNADGSSVDEYFDKKTRVYKTVINKNGKKLMDGSATFINGPKGYLWETITVEASNLELRATSHYFYGKVGKYLLLNNAVKDLQLGKMLKKGSSVTLDFVNYRLLE